MHMSKFNYFIFFFWLQIIIYTLLKFCFTYFYSV